MKPPKCRVCGKEEWRHVCIAELKSIDINTAAGLKAHEGIMAKQVYLGKLADKFDRTAYQRDLMRKRRAAKRAAGGEQ